MNLTVRNDFAVIDTNVVRMLADENRPLAQREFYYNQVEGMTLLVSFMTVHEVLWGIEKARFGKRRTAQILADLAQYKTVGATDRVIAISAHLRQLLRNREPSIQDIFVASSALALGCPLVTDDRKLVEALTEEGVTGVISRFASGA